MTHSSGNPDWHSALSSPNERAKRASATNRLPGTSHTQVPTIAPASSASRSLSADAAANSAIRRRSLTSRKKTASPSPAG